MEVHIVTGGLTIAILTGHGHLKIRKDGIRLTKQGRNRIERGSKIAAWIMLNQCLAYDS